jgi:hypothetical protein
VKIEESSGPSGLGSPPEYSPVAPVGSPTSSRGISCGEPDGSGRSPPPPTCHRASTPTRTFRPVLRFRGNHPRNPVPPSWFRATSTVSSARRSRACCIPLPVLGFVAFRGQKGLPRDDVHTPRRIPLDDSRTTSPWPLPPCRSLRPASALRPAPLPEPIFALRRASSVDFEALLRHRVRNAHPAVASREAPCPSWASFPFKVLPGDETSQVSPTSPHLPPIPKNRRPIRQLRFAPDADAVP